MQDNNGDLENGIKVGFSSGIFIRIASIRQYCKYFTIIQKMLQSGTTVSNGSYGMQTLYHQNCCNYGLRNGIASILSLELLKSCTTEQYCKYFIIRIAAFRHYAEWYCKYFTIRIAEIMHYGAYCNILSLELLHLGTMKLNCKYFTIRIAEIIHYGAVMQYFIIIIAAFRQGWEFAHSLIAYLLIRSSLICSFTHLLICSFAHFAQIK